MSRSGVGCPVMGNCKPFRITCLDIRNARWLPCRTTPYSRALDSLITSISNEKNPQQACEKSIKLSRKKRRRYDRRRSRLTYFLIVQLGLDQVNRGLSPHFMSSQFFRISPSQDRRHYNALSLNDMSCLIFHYRSELIWYYDAHTSVYE